jgi:DNA-binding GntR family transcriptional regulator
MAELHTAIARVGPNRMLQSMYLGLLTFLRDHDRRPLGERSRGALRSLVTGHGRLVEAIVANDESRCRELLGEHAEDQCELRWR